jgi:ribonuclease HI/transposase InsO family protein
VSTVLVVEQAEEGHTYSV